MRKGTGFGWALDLHQHDESLGHTHIKIDVYADPGVLPNGL